MTDHEDASFGFGQLQKLVLGVVFNDTFGEIFIRFVQFRGLVDQMEETKRIELKQIDHGLVILEADVMRKLLQSFL